MKALDGLNTLLGIAIAFAPTAATYFGYQTSPNFTGDATEILAAIVTVIGTVYAIYGRLRASSPGWFAKV